MNNPSFNRRNRRKFNAEMNVVPFIDIMLVMLIVFMVTTPLLELTQGVEVKLPEAQATAVPTLEEENQGPVIISMDQNGGLFLTYPPVYNEPTALTELLPRLLALRSAYPLRQILLRGDERVSHGEVVKLMAWLQQGGITELGILTRSPPPPLPSEAP